MANENDPKSWGFGTISAIGIAMSILAIILLIILGRLEFWEMETVFIFTGIMILLMAGVIVYLGAKAITIRERKHGKWEYAGTQEDGDRIYIVHRCSCCGIKQTSMTDYCPNPNCRARMY